MKPSLLFAPFLIFILTIQSIPSTTAATADDLVYDIAGKKVEKGVPYYIGPVVWAKGGGVKLTNTTCPAKAVQDPKEVNNGDPFIFTLNAAKEQYLRIAYPLGINSDLSTSKHKCKENSFLKISDAESKPPSNFVTNGGQFETAISCFQLAKYPKPTSAKVQSYMIQHCPWVCGAGPRSCFNISTYVVKGTKYLASSGTPFELVFKKASA